MHNTVFPFVSKGLAVNALAAFSTASQLLPSRNPLALCWHCDSGQRSEDDNEDTLSTNEIFFENKKWIDGDITMQCHSIAIPYPHITHIPFPSRSYLSGLIFASSVAMRDVTALCHESWNDPGQSRGNITDHCHQWSIKTSCWTSMKRQQSRETKFI